MVTLRKVTMTHLAPPVGARLLVHVRRRPPVKAGSNKVPSAVPGRSRQSDSFVELQLNMRLTRWDTLDYSHAM